MTQRKRASFCFTLYKIIDYLLWKRVLSCVLVAKSNGTSAVIIPRVLKFNTHLPDNLWMRSSHFVVSSKEIYQTFLNHILGTYTSFLKYSPNRFSPKKLFFVKFFSLETTTLDFHANPRHS